MFYAEFTKITPIIVKFSLLSRDVIEVYALQTTKETAFFAAVSTGTDISEGMDKWMNDIVLPPFQQ